MSFCQSMCWGFISNINASIKNQPAETLCQKSDSRGGLQDKFFSSFILSRSAYFYFFDLAPCVLITTARLGNGSRKIDTPWKKVQHEEHY